MRQPVHRPSFFSSEIVERAYENNIRGGFIDPSARGGGWGGVGEKKKNSSSFFFFLALLPRSRARASLLRSSRKKNEKRLCTE